jgi:hypothetical protein
MMEWPDSGFSIFPCKEALAGGIPQFPGQNRRIGEQ